jgi:TatA/E family protein of Tat protein translocase
MVAHRLFTAFTWRLPGNSQAGSMDISPAELLIALAIALLIFGPDKIPKLARSLGEAMHEFRRSSAISNDDVPASAHDGDVGRPHPDDPSVIGEDRL